MTNSPSIQKPTEIHSSRPTSHDAINTHSPHPTSQGTIISTHPISQNLNPSHQTSPNVAILLATYNGAKYLKAQLDSIIHQTHPNWTIYVSDDGSTDQTLDIIKSYQKTLQTKLILLHHPQPFRSAKLNFSFLLNSVPDHPYYMFCDQDDAWHPKKISALLQTISIQSTSTQASSTQASSTPLLAHCDCQIVDQNLKVIHHSFIRHTQKILKTDTITKQLLLECYIPGCVIMFNHTLRQLTQPIPNSSAMHDWWLQQVASLTGQILYLDRPLHSYRQHDNNAVGANHSKSLTTRIYKLINYKKHRSTWKTHQATVLAQAKTLLKIYRSHLTPDNFNILTTFITIMETKSPLKRLYLLLKHRFFPIEKSRILRLVL